MGSQVTPPPVLADLGQVAIADQVMDGDGKVRRALLSVRSANAELRLNLRLRLALRYLEAEGITPQSLPNHPYKMRLGKAVIVPFQANDGGYVRADAGGYQILLNYHGTQEQFQTFSIRDVLANRVPPEAVRDRAVLIGSTAESINDLFQTPYSDRIFGPPKRMAGVAIHANIASQILSAALQGRPMLPAAGQIAIEYLKQAESQENQALLEQILQELCLLETSSSDGIQKLHVREDKL